MSVYFVRAMSGRLFPVFLERGIVALGQLAPGADIGDLRRYAGSRETLRARVQAWRPRQGARSVNYTTRVLWLLAHEMKVGDRVLTYDGRRSYALGEVAGDYRYEPAWDEGPLRHPHARDVVWQAERIPRAALSPQTQKDLGAHDSVIALSSAASRNVLAHAAEPA